MPVHDWERVEAGIFHAFHTTWIAEIQNALNEGLLPEGFYALAEQHAGGAIADILTLHESSGSLGPAPSLADSGGTAVAEAPPQVRHRQSIELATPQALRRTLAIRHVSQHRLIAMIEILSPANKDRLEHVLEFADKAVSALAYGVHLLLVDLFPPGPHDPDGMHGIMCQQLEQSDRPYDLPAGEPLTLASYVADKRVEIYLEHLAVGAPLAAMPLFLSTSRYINAPLEATYCAAYRGMPAFWRGVLEGSKERA